MMDPHEKHGPPAEACGVAHLMAAVALAGLAALAPGEAHSQSMEQGVVLHRQLAADPAQEYWLYVPTTGGENAPVFVTVHGISRNAEEHARRYAKWAERYGVVLVAPLYPRERFPDYQRLNCAGCGPRADVVLEQIVAEVGSDTGARTDRLYLFGFSGGGQFVHRFALLHPERVARVAVGAAGWYTLPDPALKFPLGIRPSREFARLAPDPDRFLAVPACVLVGERDVRLGSALRTSSKVVSWQGENRFERGRHWVEAMRAAADERGLGTEFCFEALPRAGHSFTQAMRRGGLGRRVFRFLFGPPPERAEITDPEES